MQKVVFSTIVLFCFLITMHIKSIAQCNTTVLVKEDFGGNGTGILSGPALAAGITSYSYNNTGVINDGQYGIRRSTGQISNGQPHFPAWHVGTDHTGDGFMMMINADLTPGKFYETTVNNLCSGSKLFFSAWVANLLRLGVTDPLDPILRFEISSSVTGTILATYITPAIPRFSSFTWTQYGFQFTLPATENNLVLKIYNNQPGGQGNDLCIDDIEFSLCGPVIAPVVTGTYLNTSDACAGSNITFQGNVAAGIYQNPVYQWQFNFNNTGWVNISGATLPDITLTNTQPANSGLYRVLVAENGNLNSINCRSVSASIPLQIFTPTAPVLQSKSPLCEKDTLQISTTTNALQYIWTKGTFTFSSTSNSLIVPRVQLADAGNYKLDIVTTGGCSSSSSIPIIVQQNMLTRKIPFDTLLCNAETLNINAQQIIPSTYLWNDGSLSFQRTLALPGNYRLLTNDGVCKRSDSFTITRNFTPFVSIGNDTTLCESEKLILFASSLFADDLIWNTNSRGTSIIVSTPGNYSVAASNGCGTVTDAVKIDYTDCADVIFVPNAFTPNTDRTNDVLYARAYFKIDEFKFLIFNRWGQEVFVSSSILNGWDGFVKGIKAPVGLYSWKIQYSRKGKQYHQKGTVLLIY